MTYQFMRENRGQYGVTETAGLLGVSRSAYYQWAGVLSFTDARMKKTEHESCGKRASLKKAARLMRENGLNARLRRRYVRTTGSKHNLPACENTLSRDFHARQGGRKRVSDIACLRAAGGWVYLTVALDLFDRKIIGQALSDGMEAAAIAAELRQPVF